jgi:hypothetical protein
VFFFPLDEERWANYPIGVSKTSRMELLKHEIWTEINNLTAGITH